MPRIESSERVQSARMTIELDVLDRKLLDLLQIAADVPAETIGSRVGLSASAVQRRIKRLRSVGAITAVVAQVDAHRVGGLFHFLVGIEVESERSELVAALRAWLKGEPMVQSAFYVTGEWDYMLIVASRDNAGFEALMSRMLAENVNVRRYSTFVALGTIKQSLFVPL